MKKQFLYLSLLFSFISLSASAQQADTSKDSPESDKVYIFADQMPSPGFDIEDYLNKNLQYPAKALKENIQGRVIVTFIVMEDGSISNCKAKTTVGGGYEKEAIWVVKNMPRWKPAKQNGKPVKVFFTLPIMFKL